MTNTFREHTQRAIFETFDLWDIWSELWENMTWPTTKKNNEKDKDKDENDDKYIENTLKEGFLKTFREQLAKKERFLSGIAQKTVLIF